MYLILETTSTTTDRRRVAFQPCLALLGPLRIRRRRSQNNTSTAPSLTTPHVTCNGSNACRFHIRPLMPSFVSHSRLKTKVNRPLLPAVSLHTIPALPSLLYLTRHCLVLHDALHTTHMSQEDTHAPRFVRPDRPPHPPVSNNRIRQVPPSAFGKPTCRNHVPIIKLTPRKPSQEKMVTATNNTVPKHSFVRHGRRPYEFWVQKVSKCPRQRLVSPTAHLANPIPGSD